ncbi:acyl-CoA dehydrogenase family protein [Gordonia sp. HY442]|uniref:acyl-CoA dehydrogenase family protein n=1 Tax=Gordonia zhenghanii TaxID=2911516 RepID=UPI001F1A8CF7|nr:acyl-CoA dehydrogenase family protein [Gordonia zhenghanii]MCF8601973.1 acyl-CoA dehydrogenase family protein [Gordonia zhenghanii]MCF8602041.1 acyl-CoA dehydrogenase family protein [Gordonia zhenghanii]
MKSDLFEDDHLAYADAVRGFVAREVVPNLDRWEEDREIDRAVWKVAGGQGLLGLSVPERFGGSGVTDYRFRAVLINELARVGASSLQSGFSTNDDIVLNYLLRLADDEQSARWLPGFANGETIGAIAMSEPGTGSDLQGITTTATRVDGGWSLTGSKTFITSGILADLVIVVARTDVAAGSKGFTLMVVEADLPGFRRGRKLRKVGLQAQDTAELFFDDVFVPDANVLGGVGSGFGHLMDSLPLERLGIALAGQFAAEAALRWTVDYVRERRAFGKAIADFQNTSFTLADHITRTEACRAYLDRAVLQFNEGTLTAEDAAKTKLIATENQWAVIDACVQMHGGYGYMLEYPIGRAFTDARIQRIYGGTNEIMKHIIGRHELAAPSS